MAKQINTNVEQAKLLADQLQQQGIDNQKIDEWLQQSGAVEKIMQDTPLLTKYFRVTRAGLGEIVDWQYGEDRNRALAAEVDQPTTFRYQAYFSTDRDPGPVAGRDFLPENLILGEGQERLVTDGWMTPEQYENLQKLIQYGFFSDGPESGSGGAPSGSASSGGASKNYGTGGGTAPAPTSGPSASGGPGGGPKAMGVGAPGGTPKTMGTGAPPPPPPPSGGGGAYPPPPPVPGGGGPGMPGAGGQWVDQQTVDYVNSVSGSAAGMWLPGLLGDQNYANSVIGNLVQSMQADDALMRRIRNDMMGLDPTNPQDRHMLTQLGYEMGDLNARRQQKFDLLATARRKMTDRETLIKGIMDKVNASIDHVIRNTRP